MKDLKSLIMEGNNRFYPDDYYDMKDENDVIEAILDALSFSGIYKSFAESIVNGLNSSIFTDKKFTEEFGKQLSENVNEYIEENY